PLEALCVRCVDEVEGRAAVHLDRWARVMGEHEYRRMEWRVGPPPARPFGILVPPGIAELSGAHDLGADPVSELPQDGVVDAAAPAGPAGQLVPPPGDGHPFGQAVARVAGRRPPAPAPRG